MEARKSRFFYGYVVVVVAFFIFMAMLGGYNTFGVFFKPVQTELGWTREMTSAAYSITLLLAGALGIGMGRLTDKFGPRLVMTGCGFFYGLGYLLMSQITGLWQLYVFAALFGFAFGGYAAPISPIVAELFGLISHGVIVGFVFLSDGIGSALGSVLVGRIFDTTGSYQLGFLISAVLCVIGLILALLLKPIVGEGGTND